ncbi:MAG: hypothetical protein NZ555_06055 [Geminicoccaceae bacterium]|nr:hypothetical protein [Geminicoccaceae bacterium]MCX8101210.1 hypothetical protein [Geminicoccaceae bacterium]MDW8368955.1 hypothetical protein [Geminicoccaceae bacterium]
MSAGEAAARWRALAEVVAGCRARLRDGLPSGLDRLVTGLEEVRALVPLEPGGAEGEAARTALLDELAALSAELEAERARLRAELLRLDAMRRARHGYAVAAGVAED